MMQPAEWRAISCTHVARHCFDKESQLSIQAQTFGFQPTTSTISLPLILFDPFVRDVRQLSAIAINDFANGHNC